MSAFMPEKDGRRTPFAELNIAPMISVLLAVMTVFMLAAPATSKLDTLFPGMCGLGSAQQKEVNISLQFTGELHWNGAAITRAALAANFGALGRQDQQPSIILSADRHTQYELLTQVLDAAHSANLRNISFGSMTNS